MPFRLKMWNTRLNRSHTMRVILRIPGMIGDYVRKQGAVWGWAWSDTKWSVS